MYNPRVCRERRLSGLMFVPSHFHAGSNSDTLKKNCSCLEFFWGTGGPGWLFVPLEDNRRGTWSEGQTADLEVTCSLL